MWKCEQRIRTDRESDLLDWHKSRAQTKARKKAEPLWKGGCVEWSGEFEK